MVSATLLERSLALSILAIGITIGIYGLVAGIVKIDDAGLHLMEQESSFKQKLGKLMFAAAPKLMKFLSIAGTLAMFLVGGGILVHGISFLHHGVEDIAHLTGIFESLTAAILNGVIGFIIGAVVVAILTVIGKMRGKDDHASSAH